MEGGAALAAGNTVIIKPADETPLATLELAQAFDVLPPGVVSIVTGTGEEAGEALVSHRGVDLIAFTGSTRTGKHIMRIAADRLAKVNLETSGIDPFIVCEDADVDIAARAAVWARYLTLGRWHARSALSSSARGVHEALTSKRRAGACRRSARIPDRQGPLISAARSRMLRVRSIRLHGRRAASGRRPSHRLDRGTTSHLQC